MRVVVSRFELSQALFVAGAGVATAVGAGFAAGHPGSLPSLAASGAALAVVVAGFTALRFEWLVLGVVATRLTLDAFAGSVDAGLTPGAVVAGVFALVAAARLCVGALRGSLRRVSGLTKALYFLAASAGLSALFAPDKGLAIEGALEVATGVLMFGVLEQELPGRPEVARRVLIAVGISALVPVAVALGQVATGSGSTVTEGITRIHGTAVHPTPFAGYLALLVVALVAYPNWQRVSTRVWCGAAILVVSALTILTYTRSAWLAVVAALAYIALRRRPAILAVLIVGMVALYSYVPAVQERLSDIQGLREAKAEDSSLAWRLEYWGELINGEGRDHRPIDPFIGSGLHSVTVASGAQQPHNVLVQAYVELGVIGVAALVATAIAFIGHVRRRRCDAGESLEAKASTALGAVGIVLLVQGMASNVMTQPMLYWYAAAIGLYGYVHASAGKSGPGESG